MENTCVQRHTLKVTRISDSDRRLGSATRFSNSDQRLTQLKSGDRNGMVFAGAPETTRFMRVRA